MTVAKDTLVLEGRFRVLSTLGHGGMGEVYLGEQVSLGRKVALKVLKQDVTAQPGMLDRFRREARLLSSVDHPAVVKVIDFGNDTTGAWLVMDLIEGKSLRTALDAEGPFPPERAVRLLHQLAEGLAAIHAKGIIHRDLKPENVLLSSSGRSEQARLLDFGIARLVEADPDAGSITQGNLVLGTPEYVSPEQAMGQPLDARSDIYSFGVLAYRTLTGRLPFDGPGPRQFMAQHATIPPLRIEEANPTLLSTPELCAVVMRCLQKDAALRWQSADDLAHAFEQQRMQFSGSISLPPSLAVAAQPQAVVAAAKASAPAPRRETETEPGGAPIPSAAPAEPGSERGTTLPPPANELVRGGTELMGAAIPEKTEPPPKAPRLAKRSLIAVAVIVAVVIVGAVVLFASGDSTAALARTALDEKHPKDALQIVELAEKQGKKSAELSQLKAAALHDLDRHEDELGVVRALKEPGEPEVHFVEALAGHYALNSYRNDVSTALERFPQEALKERLREVAKHPASWEQLGAARYLDRQKLFEGEERTQAYVKSLQSTDCDLREIAIKRLDELKDPLAIEPLENLKPVKREGVGGVLLNMVNDCGVGDAKEVAARLRAQK